MDLIVHSKYPQSLNNTRHPYVHNYLSILGILFHLFSLTKNVPHRAARSKLKKKKRMKEEMKDRMEETMTDVKEERVKKI